MRGCLPQSHFLDICVFSPSLDFPEKSFVPHKHGERQPGPRHWVCFWKPRDLSCCPNSAHHKVGRNPPRKVKGGGEVSQEDGRCCLHPSQWGGKWARSSSWTGFAWTRRRVASPRKCPSLWQYWSPGMKKLWQACRACRGDNATSFALQGALSWYLFFFFFLPLFLPLFQLSLNLQLLWLFMR